jgi:ubiquinone/menaquinone biosynthesis C-methylase UbiE
MEKTMIKKKYIKLFDELRLNKIPQCGSYITASQYINAYKLVNKYAPANGTVLDWGTGCGHFSLFLLNENYSVTGFTIENTCTLLNYLKNRKNKNYSLKTAPESIKKLPFKNNTFDVVTSIGVLEHVRVSGGNEVESLKEIERILKPNGKFICYHFPNKYSWIEFIKKNHPYKYTKKEIHAFVDKTNFEIVEEKRYGILPRLIFKNARNITVIAGIFNIIDLLLSKLLPFFCQNHSFILRKPKS